MDAPNMTVEQIIDRAKQYQRDGADVIDLGCLPNTPFDHLTEAVDPVDIADDGARDDDTAGRARPLERAPNEQNRYGWR